MGLRLPRQPPSRPARRRARRKLARRGRRSSRRQRHHSVEAHRNGRPRAAAVSPEGKPPVAQAADQSGLARNERRHLPCRAAAACRPSRERPWRPRLRRALGTHFPDHVSTNSACSPASASPRAPPTAGDSTPRRRRSRVTVRRATWLLRRGGVAACVGAGDDRPPVGRSLPPCPRVRRPSGGPCAGGRGGHRPPVGRSLPPCPRVRRPSGGRCAGGRGGLP
jgi:hypothetical protein